MPRAAADVLAEDVDADQALLEGCRRSARDPARGIAALTPSELQVVELAAAGQTNREIAQTLFVTVKAVEWHLSNAYPKLGIRGRRELPDVLSGISAP